MYNNIFNVEINKRKEIYRGKDKEKGEYIYSNKCHRYPNFIISKENKIIEVYEIEKNIGCLDKNKIPIFQGDIVFIYGLVGEYKVKGINDIIIHLERIDSYRKEKTIIYKKDSKYLTISNVIPDIKIEIIEDINIPIGEYRLEDKNNMNNS